MFSEITKLTTAAVSNTNNLAKLENYQQQLKVPQHCY